MLCIYTFKSKLHNTLSCEILYRSNQEAKQELKKRSLQKTINQHVTNVSYAITIKIKTIINKLIMLTSYNIIIMVYMETTKKI